MNTKIAFFKESIRSIKTTGTIMPSSRFLIKKMLHKIDFNKAKVIVEYGPGNGIITNHILKMMHKDAILICFEINEEFNKLLQQIKDKRLIIINESAETIKEVLKTRNIDFVDCFVSSLPLSIIPLQIAKAILTNSKNVLISNGLFLQYQYTFNFLKTFKLIFGKKNVFLDFELINIPPAFIYKCVNTNILTNK